MRTSFLAQLSCPECSSPLQADLVLEGNAEEITAGTVRCQCSQYPIVAGILVFQRDSGTKVITSLLNRGKVTESLNILTDTRPDRFTFKGISYLERSGAPIPLTGYKLLMKLLRVGSRPISECEGATFVKTIDSLGWGYWAEYLKYRFSSPSFVGAVTLAQLIQPSTKPTLDLGCGTGHSAYALSARVPEDTLVCADVIFIHLYLAKKFFVNNAQFICLDANRRLPFRDGFFSNVTSVDGFHWVRSSQELAQELTRILQAEGILLLPHLHNRMVYEGIGYPLSPEEYSSLFGALEPRLLPESKIVEDFTKEGSIDLSGSNAYDVLNKCDTISLVASRNQGIFKRYGGQDDALLKSSRRLTVNPMYRVETVGDKYLLELNKISDEFQAEYPLLHSYLPDHIQIEKEMLDQVLRHEAISNLPEIRKLVRDFVLIDTPKNYE